MKFLTALVVLALSAQVGATSLNGGYWAAIGQPLTVADGVGSWNALDGSARVRVDGESAKLNFDATVYSLADIFVSPALSEVGWSKEVRGIFVNASDGGDTGTWQTRAFTEENGRAREIPVRKLLKKFSRIKSDCEFLNVMSIGWVDNGAGLLVIEQVPNSSGCSNMNKALLFVIDVKRSVVRETLTPSAAMERYSDLFGARTRDTLSIEPNR